MATVKIDISEWETMKSKERLLEDSLKREQELSSRINELKEEKIKALENAKMKVVKITKNQTKQFKLARVSNLTELKERLIRVIHSINGNVDYAAQPTTNNVYDYLDNLFTTTTSIIEGVPEITLHGLDEIKAELREQAVKDIDEEYKDYKFKYLTLSKVNDKYKSEVDILRAAVKNLNEEVERYVELKEKYKSANNIRIKTNRVINEYNYYINNMVKLLSSVNLFNYGTISNKIKTNLKHYQEEINKIQNDK